MSELAQAMVLTDRAAAKVRKLLAADVQAFLMVLLLTKIPMKQIPFLPMKM